MNSQMNDWESGILQALQVFVEKGAKQVSQWALAELPAMQQEDKLRTGEVPRSIYWADLADMGDVSAKKLRVGNLEAAVLDYGDSLHLPQQMRAALNEGGNDEKTNAR